MEGEIFDELLGNFEEVGEQTLDGRRLGYNQSYRIQDGIKSGFAVFFFQHPSILSFQRAMEDLKRRSNMETLFNVKGIPSDNEIRTLLDGVEPGSFREVFGKNLALAEREGVLDKYRVLDGGVLLALDGTWYFASKKVHCEHCLHKTKGKDTTYYHSALTGAIVRPGSNSVLPVMPELITNKDGEEKQDCELNAGKRWLSNYEKEYAWLKPTLLGDDLFSNHPFCTAVLKSNMSFIFTCKPTSHPWLTETVENSVLEEKIESKWNGRNHMVSTYRWINGVPIRDDTKDPLLVNYFSIEIKNKETGRITYHSSWITNKQVDEPNVVRLVECARARWKIENEHNNVLKNNGYNLEHNFGHGKNHAGEVFFMLNLLSFMFHTILDLCDAGWQKARDSLCRRDTFFAYLQAAFRFALHQSWQDFMFYILPG
jgi:hypothetical protein